jgi:NAD(P)-dependent dehydrogenase (short-subunit alcohol dehydrogenase family)
MSDTVVLVTGGAGNLGRAVTGEFLKSGHRVAVPVYKADQPSALDELRAAHGDRLQSFALDLTTERGAQQAVERVLEWGGRLDCVAHMVGGYNGGSRIHETPVEVWDRMIDLNLRTAWFITRFALDPMREQRGGSFVFTSSRAALRDHRGHAAYSVAKAGLITLAESIAEEYRDEGIRANVVLPGTVDTEANRRAMPSADASVWTAPEEIARVVVFLASSASAPVSGAAIPVYGRS